MELEQIKSKPLEAVLWMRSCENCKKVDGRVDPYYLASCIIPERGDRLTAADRELSILAECDCNAFWFLKFGYDKDEQGHKALVKFARGKTLVRKPEVDTDED